MQNESKALAAVQKADSSFLVKFGKDELNLIRESKCVDSTQAEFNLFIYDAQSRGLNPLRNEIYFVKRSVYSPKTGKSEGRASHQVGIDGFRIIAQRTGEYKGQTKVAYGAEVDFSGVKVPEYAEVGVMRKGFDEPLYARAYFNEYAQVYNSKLGTMWARMPYLMIAKCAEALALRKSFPDALGGLYTNDEMAQADVVEVDNKEKTIQKRIKEVERAVTVSERDEGIKEFEANMAKVYSYYDYTDDMKDKLRKIVLKNRDIKEIETLELIRLNKKLVLRIELNDEKREKEEAEKLKATTENAEDVFGGEAEDIK